MRPINILKMAHNSGGSGGSPGSLDTQTVTVASTGVPGSRIIGFISGLQGALSDGTSNIYSGAVILELAAEESDLIFRVTGVVANSGWASFTVAGVSTFIRAAATFSTSGGNSTWTWIGVGNPFGSSGTKIVGFN